jgi:hypothetical protein
MGKGKYKNEQIIIEEFNPFKNSEEDNSNIPYFTKK